MQKIAKPAKNTTNTFMFNFLKGFTQFYLMV